MEKRVKIIVLRNMAIMFGYLFLIGLGVTLASQSPDDHVFSDVYLLAFSGMAMAAQFIVNVVLAAAGFIRKDNGAFKAHLLCLFLIPAIGIPVALGVSLLSDAFLFQKSVPDLLE